MSVILHIDFNSYFATVEQQANPRLRGKPVGVTGGDRLDRTVLGAASVESKKQGVKTGMPVFEALRICPNLILVRGNSDKYLECTKRFLNILKSYTPHVEVFSIDECFLQLEQGKSLQDAVGVARDIKKRIKKEIGGYITCSIGVSYNKLIAKLAGSLYKPDGLVVIVDEKAACWILDKVELDGVCGIGPRIKKRLNNMGVFDFKNLRGIPLETLLLSFKSYGRTLYNMARGVDGSPVVPFYEKGEVKSVGHRHTLSHNTCNLIEIRRTFLKLTELVARRLRSKRLVGKTVTVWFRTAEFFGEGGQCSMPFTSDGLEIFNACWRQFLRFWHGETIRMVGISVSNLKGARPDNLSFLEVFRKREVMTKALDQINDRYGEFTLQRGVLLQSEKVIRKPNPFLSDRRFRL